MSTGDDDSIVIIGRAETDPGARAIPFVIPGAKLYPCHKCGVMVYIAPRNHPVIDGGHAQACCLSCMPKNSETSKVQVHWPTHRMVMEDLGLAERGDPD